MSSHPSILKRWLHGLFTLLQRANDHHIYLAASGIAFNVMLLILPTLLVIVFVIGAFVERSSVISAFDTFFRQTLPFGEGVEQTIHAVETELQDAIANYTNAGWIGIPALVWLSLAVFNSVRTALSAVFEMREHGSFWRYVLKDVVLLFIFGLAILTVNLFPFLLSELVKWLLDTFPGWDARVIASVAPVLLSKTLTFLFFVCIYRFAPNARPRWSVILTSALLYTLLWEAVRGGFSWYVHHLATYSILYGIYATVAAAAFWIYYIALALLFSAEIACAVLPTKQRVREGNYVMPHRP
jgi:membrane protein